MTTKDEALKMAIEFIDEITNAAGKYSYVNKTSLVADSYAMASKLKEALEQLAQEPVAHIKQGMDGYPKLVFNGKFEYESIAAKWDDIALYTKEQL